MQFGRDTSLDEEENLVEESRRERARTQTRAGSSAVPAAWAGATTGRASNRDAARQMFAAAGAGSDPPASGPDEDPPSEAIDTGAISEEQAALRQMQTFVFSLTEKYPATADAMTLLFQDKQFTRAFPYARPVDGTTIDVGNGSLLDVVDPKRLASTAAPGATFSGAAGQVRDRANAALGALHGASPLGTNTGSNDRDLPFGNNERPLGDADVLDMLAHVAPHLADDLKRGIVAREHDQQIAQEMSRVRDQQIHERDDRAGRNMGLGPTRPGEVSGGIVSAASRGGVPLSLDKLAPAPVPVWQPAENLRVDLGDVTYQDVDQFWDWIRMDQPSAREFMGDVPKSSAALMNWFAGVLVLAREQRARIQSILVNRRLAGFIMLYPIDRQEKGESRGTVHLYLEPAARGALPAILPPLLAIADQVEPGLTLLHSTTRTEWARVLKRAGFTVTLTLTRPATKR